MPLGGTPGPPSVVRLGYPSPDRELFGPTATTGSMEIHIPESESTRIDEKELSGFILSYQQPVSTGQKIYLPLM